MIRSTVVATALPAGIDRRSGSARLSVFLSPRLETDEGDRLKLFPEFLDWPAAVDPKRLAFEIEVDGGPTIGARTVSAAPSSELWQAIFRPSTYVEPYRFPEELATKPLSAFPAERILDYLKERFSATYVGSPTGLPTAVENGRELEALVGLRRRLSQRRRTVQQSLDAALRAARDDAGARRNRYGKEAYTGAPPVIVGADESLGVTEQDFLKFLLFYHHTGKDKPAGVPTTRAERSRLLDFHAAVSALGDHPRLLRELGLVIDVVFDPATLPESWDSVDKLRVLPKWAKGAPAGSVPTPWTAYAYTELGPARVFCAASRGAGGSGAELRAGLVNLRPDTWNLVEVDIDGAAFQTFGMVSSLFERSRPGVVRPIDDTEGEGLPALRTGGLSLLRTEAGLRLHESLSRAYVLNEALASGQATAWAEDLTRGYRVDVLGPRGNRWRTLHARHGQYSIDGGPAIPRVEDEGFLQKGLTQKPGSEQDPDVEMHVHDALARWTGWSLAVPRPGKTLSHKARAPDPKHRNSLPSYVEGEPIAEGLPLQAAYRVARGSLPRLRFGAGYKVRLRTVDLAGNSLSRAQADDLIKGLEAAGLGAPVLPDPATPLTYRRFEPIGSPELVARAAVSEGESLERLVIRSDHDRSAKDWAKQNTTPAKPYLEVNDRHIVPPKVSQLMAERHGRFDESIGTGKKLSASYAAARKEAGRLSDRKVFDTHTGKERAQRVSVATSKAGDYVINAGPEVLVPYLPDPLAVGASFEGLPGLSPGTVSRFAASGALETGPGPGPFEGVEEAVLLCGFNRQHAWPEVAPFRLEIREGDGPPRWDDAGRVLTVALPKAARVRVSFSCHPNEAALELLGIWRWIVDAAGAAPMPLDWYREMAVLGRLWPLTPSRELTLVHAVQRPLVEPKILQLKAVRDPGATFTYLNGEVRVHGASTAKLDLQARWSEQVDHPPWEDPATAPAPAPGSHPTPDGPPPGDFQGTVDGSAHVLEAQIHLLFDARDNPEPPDPAQVPAGDYDEKHDLVRLTAPALDDQSGRTYLCRHEFGDTRHRRIRYGAVATSRFRDYFDRKLAAKPENFYRQGPEVEIDVPSSARPAPPRVLYAVPTFAWERDHASDPDVQTSRRRGNGLRVYLDRPWFSSGDGELLGVVLWPDWNCPPPERLANSLTAWGKDPIWRGDPTYATPDAANFPLGVRTGSGLHLERLHEEGTAEGAPPPESVPADPAASNPLAVESETVTVVGHTVDFDSERRLWYCDLEIDPGAAYKAFVRLALVRYQPCSVPKLELSRVVVADYAQLHPDRLVTMIREPDDPDLVNLAVTGRTYSFGAGPIDPNDGGQGSLVEVDVEVRDDKEVEDELAWEPATDPAVAVESDHVAFDQALRWSGQVRLPADRTSGEYRIVIREFERFAAVGESVETPDRGRLLGWTTAKRLVFVETLTP